MAILPQAPPRTLQSSGTGDMPDEIEPGKFPKHGLDEGRVQKSEVNYQDQPGTDDEGDPAECDGCTMFVPPKGKSAKGTCTHVMGAISPTGWCQDFEDADDETKNEGEQSAGLLGQPMLGGGPQGGNNQGPGY